MENEGKSAVLLLAEDDLGDQKITKRALKSAKICNELYVVQDGEEALDYLFRRGKYADPATSPRPDLLLLDLHMPKVGGREVLEAIHNCPEFENMRIVVLTTSRQEEDILRSYHLGAHSYIVKPVDMEQFSQVISRLSEYWFEVVVLPPRENRATVL